MQRIAWRKYCLILPKAHLLTSSDNETGFRRPALVAIRASTSMAADN